MRILMVCTGNICRSAMAERVLQRAVAERGIQGVQVFSAGISDEEQGNPMDPRAEQLLRKHGYRTAGHSAQQVTAAMVQDADLILAMTKQHARALTSIAQRAGLSQGECEQKIRRYREFGTVAPADGNYDINDPWYGDMSDFEESLEYLEDGIEGLLEYIDGATQH